MIDVHIVDAGGPHELVTVELMRRQGYVERFGLRLQRTYVKNGRDATQLLLAGQADAAIQVGFGPALAAIDGGAALRVIAAANLLTVHALYSKHPQIRRLADLQQRSVGVGAPGALTHQLLYAALLKQRIDPDTVRFVSIGNSATIFKALLAGEIEAGFGETDVFEQQSQYGVHALEDGVLWRELPEFPNQASFAPVLTMTKRRDALVRVLAAHALLYRCLQSPDSWPLYADAWSTALPHAGLAEAHTQWSFYQRYRPFAEDLALPTAPLYYLQELNVKMQLQRRVLPFDSVADLSLAREALALIDGELGTTPQAGTHG